MVVNKKNSKKKKKNIKNENKSIVSFVKKYYKTIILITIIIIFLGGIIYLIVPKIRINGREYVTITYKDTYKEAGYKATMFFKDINNLVKVDNNS